MSEVDERVWLKHEATGHLFHCPAGAVADFKELGWHPTDERPIEANPMTAEMPREWFTPIPAPVQVADQPTDSVDSSEGSD